MRDRRGEWPTLAECAEPSSGRADAIRKAFPSIVMTAVVLAAISSMSAPIAAGTHRQQKCIPIGPDFVQPQPSQAEATKPRDRTWDAEPGARTDLASVYQTDSGTRKAISPRQQTDEAITRLEESLKQERTLLGTAHPTTLGTLVKLGTAYREAGRPDQAIIRLEEALEVQGRVFGPEQQNPLITMNELAGAYLEAHLWSPAENLLRTCLRLRIKKRPDEWWRFHTMSQLGLALARQEKYAEAEPLLIGGYEGLKAREATIPAPQTKELNAAAKRIVPFYRAWGKKDKADEWRARLTPPAQAKKR
jgi:hypothetical protein